MTHQPVKLHPDTIRRLHSTPDLRGYDIHIRGTPGDYTITIGHSRESGPFASPAHALSYALGCIADIPAIEAEHARECAIYSANMAKRLNDAAEARAKARAKAREQASRQQSG